MIFPNKKRKQYLTTSVWRVHHVCTVVVGSILSTELTLALKESKCPN